MPKSYKPAPENSGLTRLDFPGPAGYVRVTKFPYVTEDANEQAFLDAHPMLVGEEAKGPEPKATQKARPVKPVQDNEDRED